MTTMKCTLAKGLFLLATLPYLGAGCSGTKGAYEWARKADTIQAYQSFLEGHPSGPQADLARQRLGELKADKEIELEARLAAVRTRPVKEQALDLLRLANQSESVTVASKAVVALREAMDQMEALTPEQRNGILASEFQPPGGPLEVRSFEDRGAGISLESIVNRPAGYLHYHGVYSRLGAEFHAKEKGAAAGIHRILVLILFQGQCRLVDVVTRTTLNEVVYGMEEKP